jgi:adenylosuccinate synthase
MPLTIVVGAQWGDEGKGRVVDQLAAAADVTARYAGGDNAGHTVTVGARTYRLHLIPSGILYPHVTCVLGSGMVVNPAALLREMDELAALGVDVSPARIKISHAAHLILPAHAALDAAAERVRGAEAIGTTLRGIGPAYADKAAREGLRAEALGDLETCADRAAALIAEKNRLLAALYGASPLDPQAVGRDFAEHAARLAPYVADTALYLYERLRAGARVLAEGAQGTLLDVNHGTYPFVTSSTTTAGGALPGLGVGPQWVDRIVGVTKAFQTRVGAGPMPTELHGAEAERLRGTGENPWDEFGTTTGRPRRCGWLDAVTLRYAVRVNGLTELVVTKLDVLSGLATVRICTAYELGGRRIEELPASAAELAACRPLYEECPGWQVALGAARRPADLPDAARAYVARISALAGVPVRLVSVGPEREQIVEL